MISDRVKPSLAGAGGIREAFNEARRQYKIYGKENVYDLSLGNPSAPTPAKANEAAIRFLQNPDFSHGYMDNAGFADVRQQIIDSINRREGTAYSPDEIVMTSGVAGGLSILMYSILNPGDEVIVFAPYYVGYDSFVKTWGGEIVVVPPNGSRFWPDLDIFEKKITEKTRAIIINSPNNPTGSIYDPEIAERIAQILKKKRQEYKRDIYIVSDEPYRDLVYDGTRLPWWPSYYTDTIVSFSYSKSLSLAGERIGYLLIPAASSDGDCLIKAVKAAMGHLGFVNAPALFQKVAGACADEKVDLAYYAGNRKILYDAVMAAGFEAVKPRGAFYIFVKCPIPEKEFLELGRQLHLIMVGGSCFGYEGWVRLSFCCDTQVLEGAAPVLKELAFRCQKGKFQI